MFSELTYSLFITASYVHRLPVLEGRYLLEMDFLLRDPGFSLHVLNGFDSSCNTGTFVGFFKFRV